MHSFMCHLEMGLEPHVSLQTQFKSNNSNNAHCHELISQSSVYHDHEKQGVSLFHINRTTRLLSLALSFTKPRLTKRTATPSLS